MGRHVRGDRGRQRRQQPDAVPHRRAGSGPDQDLLLVPQRGEGDPAPEPFEGIVQDDIARKVLADSGAEFPIAVKALPKSQFRK